MSKGGYYQNRKTMRATHNIEKELNKDSFGFPALDFITSPKFDYFKVKCYKIAKRMHTQPICVAAGLFALTGQNCGGSTMLYEDEATGNGERIGMNYIIDGSPSLGKNSVVLLMKLIHKYNKIYIVEFLDKYNLEYDPITFDYFFSNSTFKLAIEEAKKRGGQGIALFVESSM